MPLIGHYFYNYNEFLYSKSVILIRYSKQDVKIQISNLVRKNKGKNLLKSDFFPCLLFFQLQAIPADELLPHPVGQSLARLLLKS